MSRFTNILVVSPYPDGKTWYLRSDFGFDRGKEGSGDTITVPIGFSTDFASIPRIFWTVLPKWGKYGNAAVVHDYLYYRQELNAAKLPRKTADDILLEGMIVLNVVPWQRFVIYHAVRWFGFFAWYSNRKMKEAGYRKIAASAPEKSVDMPTHWKVGARKWISIMVRKSPKKSATGSGE
jgi:hypothetical protein